MSGQIWDGNGGYLDPATATQRDLLIALHTKMDTIVIPSIKDHEARIRSVETWQASTQGGSAASHAISANAVAWLTVAASLAAILVTVVWIHH